MFTSERDLITAFKLRAEDFLRSLVHKSISDYFLLEEFDSRHGIADLVLGTYSSGRTRKELSRKSINQSWIRPLINLEEEVLTDTKHFMETYGVSKKTALARLREYAEAGFVERFDGDKFKLVRKYRPVTDTIISIEAKLKNWQRALQQAYRYKMFSHQSYVLLDYHNSIPAINKIRMFEELNIGLMTQSQTECVVHYKPRRKEVGISHSFLRLNEAAFAYFKFNWANA